MLRTRPIATSAAVLCFFVVGIVGSLGGVEPYTCCKRALVGAGVGYLTAVAVVHALNAIVTQALIASQINEDKERTSDREG